MTNADLWLLSRVISLRKCNIHKLTSITILAKIEKGDILGKTQTNLLANLIFLRCLTKKKLCDAKTAMTLSRFHHTRLVFSKEFVLYNLLYTIICLANPSFYSKGIFKPISGWIITKSKLGSSWLMGFYHFRISLPTTCFTKILLPIAGNNHTWFDPKVEKNILPGPVTSV